MKSKASFCQEIPKFLQQEFLIEGLKDYEHQDRLPSLEHNSFSKQRDDMREKTLLGQIKFIAQVWT